jgi:hypothetical protein
MCAETVTLLIKSLYAPIATSPVVAAPPAVDNLAVAHRCRCTNHLSEYWKFAQQTKKKEFK